MDKVREGMVYAYESITVADSAVGFTAATVDDAKYAFITVETAAVRFRTDGTNPTATEGHELEPGDQLLLETSKEVLNFKAIRRDGTSATIRCSFGR